MEIIQVVLLVVIIYLLNVIAEELKKPALEKALHKIERNSVNPPKRGAARVEDVPDIPINTRMTPSEISRDLEKKAEKRALEEAAVKLREKRNAL
jgi:hypothetical protein